MHGYNGQLKNYTQKYTFQSTYYTALKQNGLEVYEFYFNLFKNTYKTRLKNASVFKWNKIFVELYHVFCFSVYNTISYCRIEHIVYAFLECHILPSWKKGKSHVHIFSPKWPVFIINNFHTILPHMNWKHCKRRNFHAILNNSKPIGYGNLKKKQ